MDRVSHVLSLLFAEMSQNQCVNFVYREIFEKLILVLSLVLFTSQITHTTYLYFILIILTTYHVTIVIL